MRPDEIILYILRSHNNVADGRRPVQTSSGLCRPKDGHVAVEINITKYTHTTLSANCMVTISTDYFFILNNVQVIILEILSSRCILFWDCTLDECVIRLMIL